MDGWVFEEDAGARPQGIQQTYKDEVDRADLYIGLFWRDYGDYTVDEFNYATEKSKDRLIYEKRSGIDGRRDPKLQAFLDRIGQVETGLTARWFETPEELREGIKHDAARWQAQKVRALRELNASYKPSPLDAGERRDLRVLLGRVRRFWVEGVLDSTIRRAGLLELGKDTQPEAVGNPWEAVLELPFEGARAVDSGKSIAEVFDDVERSVLILGQPGSGKTTTLLTLVRELLRRAEADSAEPVPVVFHLSSWGGPEQSLDAWLVDELNDKYQIPKKIGRQWLEHHRLLLLLDGLDEVANEHRAACVEAINRFAKEIGQPGIAVCCRLGQYEELSVKLALNGAISLRPLTDQQIDAYVEEAGPELAGLRGAVRQDSGLRELARSPLMLNLMCLVYRGHDAGSFAGRETVEDRTRHLFTAYIDLMFKKRGTAELAYPRARTLESLAWIAERLSERNETLFLIEDLQPSWLSNAGERWTYLAGFSLVFGLLMGLVSVAFWGAGSYIPVGENGSNSFLHPGEALVWLTAMPIWLLLLGWVEGLGAGRPMLERIAPGMRRAVATTLISGALWVLISLAAVALLALGQGPFNGGLLLHLLWTGLVIALLFGAAGRNRSISDSIQTVESLRWSLANARLGALLGLLAGLAVGVVLPFVGALGGDWWVPLLGFAVVGTGMGAILGGFKPHVKDSKTVPNQGIRLSLRMAFLVALNAVLIAAIAAAIAGAGGFVYRAAPALVVSGFYIPALGYFAAIFAVLFLWFGGLDALKHYVLRAVLSLAGHIPWSLPRFLEQARSLNLMQRVGSAYIFVHRRLLEHLAASRRPG